MNIKNVIPCVCLIAVMAACGSDSSGAGGGSLPPRVVTESLPDGMIGTPYWVTLEATGGSNSGNTFSIPGGSLPPGLALSGDEIAGTPQIGGAFAFVVVITDDAQRSHHKDLSILVEAAMPLSITTTSLPDADQRVSYHAAMGAQGGALAGRKWSISAGSLPPGLVLSGGSPTPQQAEISGVPTAHGTFDFTVLVEDALGYVATRNLQVEVIPVYFEIATTGLPNAYGAMAYSDTIMAAGGTGVGFMWSVVAGSLPNGLTLTDGTPAATLSGTPLESGQFTFTVQVTDSDTNVASRQLDLLVNPPGPLVITVAALPDADVGVEYDVELHATGGYPPYTWSQDSGELPDGLYFFRNRIVGVPGATALGSSNFVLQVEDAASGFATLAVSISARDAGLQISKPARLPPAVVGDSYTEEFTAVGGAQPHRNWQLVSGVLPPGLLLYGWNSVLWGTPTSAGTYTFTMSVEDGNQALVQKIFELTVYDQTGPLAIRTTAKRWSEGRDLDISLEAAGGTGTGYVWDVVWGELPPGVTLSATPSMGLRGAPQGLGVYRFELEVTDSAATSVRRLIEVSVIPPAVVFGEPVRESVVFMISTSSAMGAYIDRVRTEVVAAISALPDGAVFDVVVFCREIPESQSHSMLLWGFDMESNAYTRAHALQWLNGPATNLGTYTPLYPALQLQVQRSPTDRKQIIAIVANQPNWPIGFGPAAIVADAPGWWTKFTDCQFVGIKVGTVAGYQAMEDIAQALGGVAIHYPL